MIAHGDLASRERTYKGCGRTSAVAASLRRRIASRQNAVRIARRSLTNCKSRPYGYEDGNSLQVAETLTTSFQEILTALEQERPVLEGRTKAGARPDKRLARRSHRLAIEARFSGTGCCSLSGCRTANRAHFPTETDPRGTYRAAGHYRP